jgi:hypothetical protein
MSLTDSMKNLTREIENGTKKRKESVSSMINNNRVKRLNDGQEDKNKRVQYVNTLKNDVRNVLTDDFNARKTMSSNMRKSLNIFMKNLRSTTAKLLNTFRKQQRLVAADVLGAKVEWTKLQKKK